MNKKIISLITAAVMMAGISAVSPVRADAANIKIYNANEYSSFSGRTKADVAEHYSKAMLAGKSYQDGNRDTYYSVPASTKAPYSEGVLTDDTVSAMEEMTDYYRWLVGTPLMDTHWGQDESLQYQALDRNFQFDHYISNDSKPEDMSDELWEKGSACKHNILAWGYTPRGAITGWLNEGYSLSSRSWGTTGHRYALIDPDNTSVRFGYSGTIAIGKDEYKWGSALKYVDKFSAFPSPGPMPAEALDSPGYSSWNANWDSGEFVVDDKSAVKVTIKNTNTGTEYVRTTEDETLKVSGTGVDFVQAEDYNTSTDRYDSSYRITISGLKDKNGSDAAIEYIVDFFDVSPMTKSYVSSVGLTYDNIGLSADMMDKETLQKIACGLPKTVTVKTDTGNTFSLPAKGSWKLDTANKCFKNSADASKLPELAVNRGKLLDDIRISYAEDSTADYFGLYLSPYGSGCKEKGSEVSFKTWRYMMNCESATLCRVTTDDKGNIKGEVVYDSVLTPDNVMKDAGNYNAFTNPSVGLDDVGEYFSINYSTGWYNTAYISSNFVKLNVHDYKSVVKTEPTCTKDGVREYKCIYCEDTYTEPINALGHKTSAVAAKEATCVDDGNIAYVHCTRCQKYFLDSTCKKETTLANTIVKAKGHSFGKWTTTKAAACTVQGVQTRTCSKCKKAETRSVAATGHSYSSRPVAPTCTDQGYTEHTCTVCGDSYKTDFKSANGHHFDEGEMTKAPTYESKGEMLYRCTECGTTRTVTVPKLKNGSGNESSTASKPDESMSSKPRDGSSEADISTSSLPSDDSRPDESQADVHPAAIPAGYSKVSEDGRSITIAPEYGADGSITASYADMTTFSDISDAAAAGCTRLVISEGVTGLDLDAVMKKFPALTEIEFPKSVEDIYTASDETPNIKVICAENSFADVFARANGMGTEYTESKPEYDRGDVNGDGDINVTDIAMLAAHIKGIKALDDDAQLRADVNGDNDLNVTDIGIIAAHIKGIKAIV